jgi:predicted  nucleic acid-binding Zn-ribbon protein
MEAFSAGTLAGAGSFRCDGCGFAVALHERDPVPACPDCGGRKFRRAALFGEAEPPAHHELEAPPEWLDGARAALVRPGDYLAFEDDERVRVVPLQEGWTRIGRSLSAHIRFDDPTVSRRHALIVLTDSGDLRALDDRSLNGLFVNGERVEWAPLADEDELEIGRYRLYVLQA